MKYATPQLISLLRNNTRLPFSDCFTLVTNYGADIGQLSEVALGNPVGQTSFYTNSDAPVQIGNFYYRADGLRIKGIRYKVVKGLSVDEQTITIFADDTNKVGTIPFIQAIANGLLDGARFKQERAFFDPATWPARPGDPNKAVGSIVLFSGAITNVEDIGRTAAMLKVRSDLSLLDVDMPRNLYQPSCLHTLYDGGCGLKKTLFLVPGVITSTSTTRTINWTNTRPTDYFAQGVVKFTSGQNQGQSRPVRSSSSSGFVLTYPLQFVPAVSDSFVIYPGCDHTKSTCGTKFMNDRNFRGFPYVPPPETAV